jgi:tetratricopeptide (TPR) repeat protein
LPFSETLAVADHPKPAPTEGGEISPHQGHPGVPASVTFSATDTNCARLPPPPPGHVPSLEAQTLAPSATPAPIPAIPGYEILGVLGRGGMGVVYQARQTRLQRLVALKMILAGGHASDAQLARFRTEGEAAARLQHPNVVQVHEVGDHQGLPFYALEYVAGGSLAGRLDGTPWQSRPAAQLVETLARAVHAAHQHGIVHRDLKPANVLLAADGAPKITDFGLAKLLDSGAGPTSTGDVMGTPSYMAPEQSGQCVQPIGPATDVYALGAILYELLTGRPPFKSATALETVYQVIHQEPVPPRQLQPKAPRDLETICLKCLQKEPARRYASALALADDLRRFLQDQPIQARPAGKLKRLGRWCRRNPKVAGLVTALVLVVAAGTATVTCLWLLAEERRRTAENNLALAERRHEEARANRRKARDAVDRLAVIGDEWLRHVPHQENLRRALLEEALRLHRELPHDSTDDPEVRQELARTNRRLGRIYQLIGERQEAEKLFRQAVDLSKSLSDEFPTQAEYRNDLADYYGSLGHLLRDTKPREAEEAFRQGLALQKEVIAVFGGVPAYRSSLAILHNNLGMLLDSAGRTREAEESYGQAQEIWLELAAADPDNPEYQVALGGTHSNLGKILMFRGERSRLAFGASTVGLTGSTLGQGPLLAASALIPERLEELPQARRLVKEAIDHQHKALRVRPNYTQSAEYLGIHYDNLGAIEKRLGHYGEAEKALRESKRVRELLADNFSATPDYRHQLGGVLNNLAIVQKYQGNLAEARRSVEQAVTHQQAARKMDPNAPLYQQYLYNHYWNLADILVLQGEHGEAVRAAAELAGVFPRSGEKHVIAAWFVARCLPLAERDATLSEGKRKEVVQTYADQAMRYLRDGAAKGPVNVEAIQDWPAFEPLRPRADYKKLLAELQARGKPAPR